MAAERFSLQDLRDKGRVLKREDGADGADDVLDATTHTSEKVIQNI